MADNKKKKKSSAANKGYTAVGLSEEEMTKAKRSGIMNSENSDSKVKKLLNKTR